MAQWTEDENYYIWTGDVRIPKTFDASTQAAVIMLGPTGGIAEIPALVQGDPGLPPEFGDVLTVELAHDDPTPASVTFTEVVPGSATVRPVYDVEIALHRGEPGDAVDPAILDATDLFGTATNGYSLTYSSDADGAGNPGLVWTALKVGGLYYPTTIATTTGTDGQLRTLATVSIPAQPFAYRPRVGGQQIVSGTVNTRPHLIARLDATNGEVVGRGRALPGVATQNIVMSAGVPAGSASDYGVVEANAAATIYIRAEEQASTLDNFATTGSDGHFEVEVKPLP